MKDPNACWQLLLDQITPTANKHPPMLLYKVKENRPKCCHGDGCHVEVLWWCNINSVVVVIVVMWWWFIASIDLNVRLLKFGMVRFVCIYDIYIYDIYMIYIYMGHSPETCSETPHGEWKSIIGIINLLWLLQKADCLLLTYM